MGYKLITDILRWLVSNAADRLSQFSSSVARGRIQPIATCSLVSRDSGRALGGRSLPRREPGTAEMTSPWTVRFDHGLGRRPIFPFFFRFLSTFFCLLLLVGPAMMHTTASSPPSNQLPTCRALQAAVDRLHPEP
ncbi:hypothetical protein BDW42DRAFT_147601 [Aspergillus taichungensis]|uniref:Uncharacterized protein n=1 Tax=Aspergillus taichungensis TaxID=482145 RepID=A0A2J5HLV6_9EURO|nr:hypothetical protein BDW42DRAFT_147601 [Aspergillus taichungensis]